MVAWMGDEPGVRAWVNADQAAGEFRVRYAELFDAEARLHELRLHAAASVGAAEHVLDIGCGTGRSTRAAGRAAALGTVLGVDISAPVLELARQLTDREGLRNVSYRLADAQVDGLGSVGYDRVAPARSPLLQLFRRWSPRCQLPAGSRSRRAAMVVMSGRCDREQCPVQGSCPAGARRHRRCGGGRAAARGLSAAARAAAQRTPA